MTTTYGPLLQYAYDRRDMQTCSGADGLNASPYAEHLPNLEAVMRDSDFRMELKHLLGDARFRSIRQHCLVYC